MKNSIINIFSAILFCCFFIFLPWQTSAQSSSSWEPTPWYLGIKGGIPFGVSTFSSFGKDKMRLGWDAGIYGGYNINLTFSVEAFFMNGKISGMSVQDDFDYWLDKDGEFSFQEYPGVYSYNNIYSTSTIQRYGLQWNIDIVQALYQDEDIHFKLVLSPAVSAISTKPTIKKTDNGETVSGGDRNINICTGSDLSLGYKLNNHVTAQIYSNFSWVFGSRIDGMPTHLYDNNFIMEYGIKLGWTFGKKIKKVKVNSPAPDYEESQINYYNNKIKRIEPSTIVTSIPEKKDSSSVNDSTSVTEKKSITQPKTETRMSDLIIYSSFNEYFIDYRYIYSMKEITEKLKSDETLKLYITGWSDNIETEKTDVNLARKRADSVRTWFLNKGIARERIYVNEHIINLAKSNSDTNNTRKTEIRIIK